MYECEVWTNLNQLQKKLESLEMWFLQSILRISCTAKKSYKTVLQELKKLSQQELTKIVYINARQPFSEIETSHNNCNDLRETVRKDVGWANKVAKYRTCTESNKGLRYMKIITDSKGQSTS